MMDDSTQRKPLINLLPYQRAAVESPARFRWDCWARQTGKSFTTSLRRILRGLRRRRTQIFLSAGERQSKELMAKARQHCEALKIATDYYDNRYFKNMSIKQLEIVLPGGVRIIGLPANPQTARGYTGDVLLDEFAMHADDREIWAAMFPTLLRGDGELDVASTPKGCGNVFYELRRNDRFTHSTLTLPDAIAEGLNADVEEMRNAIGDELIFRQEFLCEFLDGAHAFLPYEQIARCTTPTLRLHDTVDELRALESEMSLGVDIGRHRDLTVFWVLGRETDESIGHEFERQRGRKSAALEQRPPTLRTLAMFELAAAPFRTQQALLSDLLNLPQVRRCCIDAGGLGMQLAEQAVERFGTSRVEPVTLTVESKSQMAAALRLAVENRTIAIPQDARIINDWHSIRREMTEAGHFRLVAPRADGSHADRFWAAALAIRAAQSATTGPNECLNIKPIQFAKQGTW